MPPQLSLYIDRPIYMELRSKAKEEGKSMSGYVNDMLKEKFDDGWPDDFFDLFGSLKDHPIELPEDLPWIPDEDEIL
ncbi:MAG: hypothetical protein FWG58_04530 [Methanomassiliicoccaceae archaeon]|nr:hypothetical protein [Methanomassiliicoccaceae archaeon]